MNKQDIAVTICNSKKEDHYIFEGERFCPSMGSIPCNEKTVTIRNYDMTVIPKCDVGKCIHQAWVRCLRCSFRVCGDCHDLDIKEYPGDGTDYCIVCAEYHEEWEEIGYMNRLKDKAFFEVST